MMDKNKARKILAGTILANGDLDSLDWYLSWEVGEENATLDGVFNAEELEAIAWWMRNIKKGEKNVR